MGVVLPFDPAVGLLVPGGPQTRNPRYFAVPQGLVGYWGFDPDNQVSATLTADMAAGNTGTINASSTYVPGVVGNALHSASTTQKMTAPVVLTPTAYSFAFWLRESAIPGATVNQPFLSDNSLNAYTFCWGHSNASFKQSVAHRNSGGTFFLATLTSTLAANTWYFIVGTWDGTTVRAYLNGNLEASTATTGVLTTQTGSVVVGNVASGLSCDVDDCRIYNRALDPGEVQLLYQVGLAGRRDAMALLPGETEAMIAAFMASGATPSGDAQGPNSYHRMGPPGHPQMGPP